MKQQPNPRCNNCGYEGPHVITTKIPTTAWLTFAVGLIICFPLCWIPFLTLKETTCHCGKCGTRVWSR